MTDEAKRCIEALRVRCRERDSCDGCAKDDYCHYHGNEALHDFAADLIESLAAELEQVKRERDAAVEDLAIHKFCHLCAEDPIAEEASKCPSCVNKCYWQWRGVRE